MLPIVSIVTPSFNQAAFIERTIHSVLSQNYPNLEYIVVDGGSTDGTLEILKKYEGRLRWISEKDNGQSNAINKGFRMAKGEILGWLNSDDIYLRGALDRIARHFAAHDETMMVYGEGYIIDEKDRVKCRFPFTEPKFDLGKLIYHGDYILQQSTFFRRGIFDHIGMIDESLHYGMDWDLFIRIGKRFRVDYIPEFMGCIREHNLAKTSVGGKRRFGELVQIIRKHGILRYPPSYWNYAWDAYGKNLVGADVDEHRTTRLRKWFIESAKRILQRVLSFYLKRLQQGHYSDGWVGKRAMFVLPNFNPNLHTGKLLIEGEAHPPNVPLRITIIVSGKTQQGQVKVSNSYLAEKAGEIRLSLDLPADLAQSECFHVQVKNNKTFVPRSLGISSDARALGFLLKKIEAVKRDSLI